MKKNVIKIWINELSSGKKPAYFRADGLPSGAFRRIASTDQHCTDDDMHVFYQDTTSFDQTPVKGITLEAVDENAIKRYRVLRAKVNPSAEELTYDDAELLQALGCINPEKPNELNVAGVVLFGKSMTQRSTFPMLRIDYIRVPGNEWVPDPDDRFTTIDMRGPLLLVLYRMIDAINADLPKGFLLPEDSLQAESSGLPLKALREAIVNALMHRSYKVHRPTQVIRYNNRIEIINPGFSLKSEDKLGQPGSETRNPFIAAVFHDTNLAETKGSGIRAMRKLMHSAHLAPPTFESSREDNEFKARLLLHHFLNEKDLEWLKQFEAFKLSDPQKQALIFVREVGAIDNQTYRQMADCDSKKASVDLRMLKSHHLFESKGKGKFTYYIPGTGLHTETSNTLSTQPHNLSTPPLDLSTPPHGFGSDYDSADNEANINLSTPPFNLSTPPRGFGADYDSADNEANINLSTPPLDLSTPPPSIHFDESLQKEIDLLNRREHNSDKIKVIIKEMCKDRYLSAKQISGILNKGEDYIKRKYLSEMIKNKELVYLHAEMINHPEQAYKTNEN